VWLFLNSYPQTVAGLLSCYAAGIPLFWNTLAGDAVFATLLFGGYTLAEHYIRRLRESAVEAH
jgi:hypothetical protein